MRGPRRQPSGGEMGGGEPGEGHRVGIRRLRGQGAHADLLQLRYATACKRLGLATRLPALRTDVFACPPRAGDQLSLF